MAVQTVSRQKTKSISIAGNSAKMMELVPLRAQLKKVLSTSCSPLLPTVIFQANES